jgi:hypothetical protein
MGDYRAGGPKSSDPHAERAKRPDSGWRVVQPFPTDGDYELTHDHDGPVPALVGTAQDGTRVATCPRCGAVIPLVDFG